MALTLPIEVIENCCLFLNPIESDTDAHTLGLLSLVCRALTRPCQSRLYHVIRLPGGDRDFTRLKAFLCSAPNIGSFARQLRLEVRSHD
jgi:hypothetical protein